MKLRDEVKAARLETEGAEESAFRQATDGKLDSVINKVNSTDAKIDSTDAKIGALMEMVTALAEEKKKWRCW